MVAPDELAEEVAGFGLLTERQAQAYLLRDVYSGGRVQAADHMGITASALDNHLARAREKLEAARRTVERLDDIDRVLHPPVPTACAECGEGLGGAFSENDVGEPICLDCAGIDPEAVP